MDKRKIAVLAGGWSSEREVSVNSGETVYEALDKEKYDVMWFDPRDDLKALMAAKGRIDLCFILLHGKLGEDGCIQGMLRVLGIPFLGSDVLASAMSFNKRVAKERYESTGLTTPKDVFLRRREKRALEEIVDRLGPATVVKPVAEGSSIGTSICLAMDELAAGIEKAFQYDDEIMIEEYVDGCEVTCCILGNQGLEALPLVEIVPNKRYRFFDYEAKYMPGATKEICPARISIPLTERAQEYAKTAHRAMGCRVWSRTDMIIRDESIYVLETNTIPGMTKNSLFPLAARAAGLSLSRLLDRLIDLALEGA